MKGLVAVNVNVYQFGTHVGLALDFICNDLDVAYAMREELLVKSEATQLLSQLGFDLDEISRDWEETIFGYAEDAGKSSKV